MPKRGDSEKKTKVSGGTGSSSSDANAKSFEEFAVRSLQSRKSGYAIFGVGAFCASLLGAWLYAKKQEFTFTARMIELRNEVLSVRESQLLYDKRHYMQFRENADMIDVEKKQIEDLSKRIK